MAETADNPRLMESGVNVEQRVERISFETDRHIIVGDVTLPAEGYQSRFSDSINRPDVSFIPVTDVEMTPLGGGGVVKRDFVVVGKAHVRVAYPID